VEGFRVECLGFGVQGFVEGSGTASFDSAGRENGLDGRVDLGWGLGLRGCCRRKQGFGV
jgi:hypothetical protein